MNHRVVMLFILLAIIVLEGCQMAENTKDEKPSEMDPEDLPDVEAFNDEFTREFLQSVNETEEGIYPFLSGTKKYRVDFPSSGIMGEKSYAIRDDSYEELAIHIKEPQSSIIRINYYQDDSTDLLQDNLEAFKTRIGYDGDFEELDKNNRTIYYANEEGESFRDFFAYVLNTQGEGAVEIVYTIDCRNQTEEICEENKKNDQERAMKWIESVEFIDNEESENHER